MKNKLQRNLKQKMALIDIVMDIITDPEFLYRNKNLKNLPRISLIYKYLYRDIATYKKRLKYNKKHFYILVFLQTHIYHKNCKIVGLSISKLLGIPHYKVVKYLKDHPEKYNYEIKKLNNKFNIKLWYKK